MDHVLVDGGCRGALGVHNDLAGRRGDGLAVGLGEYLVEVGRDAVDGVSAQRVLR